MSESYYMRISYKSIFDKIIYFALQLLNRRLNYRDPLPHLLPLLRRDRLFMLATAPHSILISTSAPYDPIDLDRSRRQAVTDREVERERRRVIDSITTASNQTIGLISVLRNRILHYT